MDFQNFKDIVEKASNLAELLYGPAPRTMEVEPGNDYIEVTYQHYLGCGDYETESYLIHFSDLLLDLQEVKARKEEEKRRYEQQKKEAEEKAKLLNLAQQKAEKLKLYYRFKKELEEDGTLQTPTVMYTTPPGAEKFL
jgi:ssDNA-binding Zn-finger/Zn-ribbon topoisomerase 1